MQCGCNSQFSIDNIVRKKITENLISNIQALQGGLSSSGVYKFKNDDKEYVLRRELRKNVRKCGIRLYRICHKVYRMHFCCFC